MTKESASRLSFLRSSGGPSRFPANAAPGLDRPLRSVITLIKAKQPEHDGTRNTLALTTEPWRVILPIRVSFVR